MTPPHASPVSRYRARWLVPVEGPPLEDGLLVVANGRIAEIGRARDLGRSNSIDLGDSILLPGFVNAHTHLELTCYHGMIGRMGLWDWFTQLIPLRFRPESAEQERQAVMEGARQSLEAGVTCVGDISRRGIHVSALRDSPIRKVCFLELISGAEYPPNDVQSLADLLAGQQSSTEPDRLMLGITPHAPYTVTLEHVAGAVALAAQGSSPMPLTMHLLETPEEAQWLTDGTGPLAPFLSGHNLPTARAPVPRGLADWLTRSQVLRARPLLAHVNYIDDAGLDLLAASEASVVWCPRAHAFFGHRPHRWRAMLSRGINVCVGTDSLASNDTLSILDELRFVHLGFPDAPATIILEMGTLRGSTGLGLQGTLGSLRPGKRADFVVVASDPDGPSDPIENLLGGRGEILGVWIENCACVGSGR